MAICGRDAVRILDSMKSEVDLRARDGTDKFWCYKLKGGSRAELAFDPDTKTKLLVRLDRKPASLPGIVDIEDISFDSVSTALGRVFSGGAHSARFKARVESESALRALVASLA